MSENSSVYRQRPGKRVFDVLFAGVLLVMLCPLLLFLVVLVRVTSPGPAVYWSDRVGRLNSIFRMPKFRSMHAGTPQVATHLLTGAISHVTPLGRILRKTSLDELPQLWSILRGDLSFVGPRPALFNQHDLIELRTAAGIDVLRPGLTGWAQVNGRDELSIPVKVEFDKAYLQGQSARMDARILWRTLLKTVRSEGVRH